MEEQEAWNAQNKKEELGKSLYEMLDELEKLEDPRRRWGHKLHALTDILFIVLCAIMCGMQDIDGIVIFGQERKAWLKQYIPLKNDVPSYSTFERVLGMIKPKVLDGFYRGWVKSLQKERDFAQVSIDGKTICGAGAMQKVHMVSALARENGLCLGQVRTSEKSNEIPAIKELIEMLDVSECVVTIDAMGCQREIATAIVKGKADYLLAVKGNQATMHEEVVEYMNFVVQEHPENVALNVWTSPVEKGHGRIEQRTVTVASCPDWEDMKRDWQDLHTLIRYDVSREVLKDGKKTFSTRYYISSIQALNAELIAGYLRGHWAIENQLHWVLDVVFKEDASTIRMNHAPENLNLLRKIAIGFMRNFPTEKKQSGKAKLARAAFNPLFLQNALFGVDSSKSK